MNRPLWTYEQINEKTVQKLKTYGFQSKEDVEKNIEGARKFCDNIEDVIFNEDTKCLWKNGLEMLEEEKLKLRITTMSKYLDELLNGGIELGKLTEIYGNSGSGKTQLCIQLAINVTLPQLLGGLEGESVYIETSKSVFSCRLGEMVDAFVEHVRINIELKNKMMQCQTKGDGNTRNGEENKQLGPSIRCKDNEPNGNVTNEDKSEINESNGNTKNFQSTRNSPNSKLESTHKRKPKENTSIEPAHSSTPKHDNLGKELKVNMTRKNLAKLINQSKHSKTNFNQFLHIDSSISEASDVTRESILSKIHTHYCANYYEILALVFNIKNHLETKRDAKIKLIILDNITFLFHGEEDANYLKRTKNVYFLLNLLSNLAVTHNLAVVIVNQLTTKYGSGGIAGNTRKVLPALGETFAHRMQVRLLMQKFDFGAGYGAGQCDNFNPVTGFGGHSVGIQLGADYPSDLENKDSLFVCLVDKMCLQNGSMENRKHVVFQICGQGVRDV